MTIASKRHDPLWRKWCDEALIRVYEVSSRSKHTRRVTLTVLGKHTTREIAHEQQWDPQIITLVYTVGISEIAVTVKHQTAAGASNDITVKCWSASSRNLDNAGIRCMTMGITKQHFFDKEVCRGVIKKKLSLSSQFPDQKQEQEKSCWSASSSLTCGGPRLSHIVLLTEC